MLPPQAPPAVTSHANQAAIDTLRRLGDTQAWLAAQQRVLSEQPLAATDDATSLMGAFWSAPVEHVPGLTSIARREAFTLRLADAAKDIASLRADDGTLSADALDLILAVANHPPGTLPPHRRAFELMAGEVAYAGALVLEDDRRPDLAMLFTVQAGWETFASLDELQREYETRLRERLASDGELPGVATSDIRMSLDGVLVGVRSIDRDPFETIARRLVARAAEQATTDSAPAVDDIATLGQRVDLHGLLDVHAMVAQRDALLANALQQERLARQPANVRADWLAAFDGYMSAGLKAARVRSEPGVPYPLDFAQFTREALIDGLLMRGHDIDPDNIRVRIHAIPESIRGKLELIVQGPPWETMTLSKFALRNIGSRSNEYIVPTYPDGTVRTDVTASAIKDLVRELDLPRRYALHLDETRADVGHGKRRRTVDIDLLRARMRFDANEARLGYADAGKVRSFLPDANELGFRWVSAMLDRTNGSVAATVGADDITVRQLTYRGAPLAGVLLIAPRSSASRVVLYTPDAPDGIAFREFESRARLERDFLRSPFLESYLVARLPLEFSAADAQGIRHFSVSWASRTSQWAFGGGDCGFCTRLEENFSEADIQGSALDAFYDTGLDLAKRDAHHLARTTGQADRESVIDVINAFFSSLHGGSKLVSDMGWTILQSIPRTTQAAWRFYDNVKAGDGTQAFLDFVDGYTSALNVVGLHGLPRAVVGSVVRTGLRSGAIMRSGKPVTAPGARFEERFVARDAPTWRAGTEKDGVVVVGDAHYIRQGGQSYRVAFDRTIDSWRLTRPGAPDANFSGPAIQRVGDQWQYRNVGLRGGGPTLPKSHGGMFHFRHISRWERSRHRFTAELDDMSPQELVDFQADVYTRLGQADGNRVFAALGRRRLAGVPSPRVSSFEEGQWDLALLQARARRRAATAPSLPRGNASEPRPGTSAQATAAATREPPQHGSLLLEGFERIPASALPEEVFYYATPRELAQDASTFFVTLLERRIALGVQGVPVLTSPPTTALSSLDATTMRFIPRTAAPPGSSLGESSGAWVRLRLREAYAADTEFGAPATFEAFRSTTPGSTAVVLRRPGALARVGAPEAALGFFNHYSIHFAPR
ncbi:DUF6543 domain-containing protein [Luteibacter sp. CQ10]|uniref:dermonecrotic toxin domain-containing protein n=1 Tax=Luteibacter sp. CQ10 TaxID=2805821 RepID=UPI0034A1DEC7